MRAVLTYSRERPRVNLSLRITSEDCSVRYMVVYLQEIAHDGVELIIDNRLLIRLTNQ